MTKIIKLTEADLTRIIKRVTKEQMVREDFPAGPQKAGSTVGLGMDNPTGPQNAGATGTTNVSPRIQNISNILKSLRPTTVQVIQSQNPTLNGMSLKEYLKTFKVTADELKTARNLNAASTGVPPTKRAPTTQKPAPTGGTTPQKAAQTLPKP